jgi:D-hydroxyproline dehydrogenase subunit gamma
MRTDATTLHITINGKSVVVPAGTSVAAAMLNAGATIFRRSVTGESRLPLCGMGICMECRVTIDGRPQQKSCQILVQPGMEVLSDE